MTLTSDAQRFAAKRAAPRRAPPLLEVSILQRPRQPQNTSAVRLSGGVGRPVFVFEFYHGLDRDRSKGNAALDRDVGRL